jgi:peptidoglycan/LPS O-acetylase OafA/YrhL
MLYLILLLVGISFVKLRHIDSIASIKPFDVDATLPLRGILALLIVVYHLSHNFQTSPLYIGIIASCDGPVVSTFFFLSGYGLVKSYQKKGRRYLDHFLTKRLGKILPLFLILSAVFVIFPLNPTLSSAATLFGLLRGETPLPYSWFIVAITYFYVAFYGSCRLSKSPNRLICNVAIATALYYAITVSLNWGGRWYSTSPAFLLGVVMAVHERKYLWLLVNRRVALVGLYVALLLTSIAMQSHYFSFIPQNALMGRVLYFTLVPISVMIAVNTLGMVSNTLLRYLGNLSLDIYLLHGVFITLFVRYGYPWFTTTILTIALTIVGAMAWQGACNVCRYVKNTPPQYVTYRYSNC